MWSPIPVEDVERQLVERGVAVVVGIYGSGKGIVLDNIADRCRARGHTVVRLSGRDLPVPTVADILDIVGAKSYVALHAEWRRAARAAGNAQHKLVIVVEEAQVFLPGGEALWEIITSLRYYQQEHVWVVLGAQPAILTPPNMHIARLLRGNTMYTRRMRAVEVAAYAGDAGLSPTQARRVARFAYEHYGTVKYLLQLFPAGTDLRMTEHRIVMLARERGEMSYFAEIMWRGLTPSQQVVVRQYLASHGHILANKPGVEQLVSTGLLWRGGRQLHWFVPWTLPFVREYVASLASADAGDWRELGSWGKKEICALKYLDIHRGEAVTYDALWEAVATGEELSLWALSRLITRVRTKLVRFGYPYPILTVRGVGYRWE